MELWICNLFYFIFGVIICPTMNLNPSVIEFCVLCEILSFSPYSYYRSTRGYPIRWSVIYMSLHYCLLYVVLPDSKRDFNACGRIKFSDILQTTNSISFCSTNLVRFQLGFHLNSFQIDQVINCYNWCRWWFGAQWAPLYGPMIIMIIVAIWRR